jgi:hypothetical protein
MGDRFGWCQTLENVDNVLNMTYDYAIENNPNLNWIDEYRYNSSVTQVINKRFPGSMTVKKTEGGIKNVQNRLHKTKTKKTQYVLDTTMRKETQMM